MRCFYNPQHEAVGTCRSCLRGICTNCLTDLDRGLARKGRCEPEAQKILDLLKHNYRPVDLTPQSTYNYAAFQIFMGLGFMVPAVASLFSQAFSYSDAFLLVMGVVNVGWVMQLCHREEKVRKRLKSSDTQKRDA